MMLDDILESEEFYNLMQAYRLAPLHNQSLVLESYEEVKMFLVRSLVEPLRVAQEFIAEHVGVEPDEYSITYRTREHDGNDYDHGCYACKNLVAHTSHVYISGMSVTTKNLKPLSETMPQIKDN